MILEGRVAPGYERVQRLYERNMRTLAERNTQLCVYVGDECVVDLWGSAIDDRSFNGDSLVNVFSSGKSLESILMARLNDQALLDYTAPVTRYWPEFGAAEANRENGPSGATTVADVMRHEAGLAAFDTTLPLASLAAGAIKTNAIGAIIERQTQRFPVGKDTQREYHAMTRGFIANEIFRRIEPQGRTMGEYLREEISQPLAADVYLGLQDAEIERHSKVAMLGFGYQFLQGLIPRALGRRVELNLPQTLSKLSRMRSGMKRRTTLKAPAPIEGMKQLSVFDSDAVSRGEIPSAAAKCSARGLAKLASVMANGGATGEFQLLGDQAMAALHDKTVSRQMMSITTEFTQGGLAKFGLARKTAGQRLDSGMHEGREGYFGWMGLGGSIFQWHPEKRIGFAYVPTSLNVLDMVNERGKAYQVEVTRALKDLA